MFKLSSLFEKFQLRKWVGQRHRNSGPFPSSVIFVVAVYEIMKFSFHVSANNAIWPSKCIVFGYFRLPESDEDDGKKTSPFESRESSSDLSEPCMIEEDTVIACKEDELEQLFTGDEIDPENDEFCKFIFMVYISFYRHFKIP